MKILKFWFVPVFILFCVGLVIMIENNVKVIDLETKVDTFDVEIKGLTNIQKRQMDFASLQTTINQLGFCLQATQLENQELMSVAKQAVSEVDTLKTSLQQAAIIISNVSEENADLKKQLKRGRTT